MSRKSILWRDTSIFLSFSRDMTERTKGLKELELTMLRDECIQMDLEDFYTAYVKRLNTTHLCSFMFILVVAVCLHIVLMMFTLSTSEKAAIIRDVVIYIAITILVLCIMALNFAPGLQRRCPHLTHITTITSVILLIAMDIIIPFTHSWAFNLTVPLYHAFTILSIYFFMPIHSYLWTIGVAMSATFCYAIFYNFFVYNDDGPTFDTPNFLSEGVFLCCINLLGIFVRVSREVVTRMIFLDKRQCIEEKLLFYAAKDQERNLLLSMIPPQIAKQMEVDVRMRIEVMKNPKASKPHTFADVRKLFIEPHEDVTILYADIVNYTHLTTTLDVKTLVGTLHDLYVRFDDAASDLNVLRIQFLGDCYYCVANVSIPNEEHATSCVKLGLRMISDIRAVRDIRRLEIDMRIGVHSGSVLSGVIGANKWQFDIYSRDVDIANRLESTGVPGRVHISAATLGQLDGKFQYESGTQKARDDHLLRKYQIITFLIKELQPRKSVFQIPIDELEDQNISAASSFVRLKNSVTYEMAQESIRMPTNSMVGHYKHLFFGRAKRATPIQQEVRNFYSNISWMFMCYKNWRWELGYMQQTDIMHKYSICVAYIIILGTITMQAVHIQQSLYFWCLVGIGNVFLLLTALVVWYKKLWSLFCSTLLMTRPFKGFSLWLYKLSERMQRQLNIRNSIYIVTLLLQASFCIAQLLDCDRFTIENEVIEMQAHEEDATDTLCFAPWAFSESVVLQLALTFLFSHISYTLKWLCCVAILFVYSIFLFVMFTFIFEVGLSSNQSFFPEYAHIIFVLTATLAFHLVNREIEFISRMDYNWKHELRKKKEHAKFTNETISILISNILPSHIVDIYMRDQLTDLYYEEYDNVAVMFATIQNFDTAMVGMRILNEIICDFDEVLLTYQGRGKVEKIKVAGWTYMAACGLNKSESTYRKARVLQRERSSRSRTELRMTALSNSELLSQHSETQAQDGNFGSDFVYVMTCFALDLLRCMKYFNEESIQGEDKTRSNGVLRIGISNGPVMAGVVGLYKPFYDIWGNAVNMASRMDSTGIPGLIQVTEETADILRHYNIQSTFRGQTFVKGRGEIPTYFVDIDEQLHFKT